MVCPGPICCTTILSRASLSLSDGGAEASIDHEREIMAVSDAVGARDGMEVVGTVVGSMPDILLEMTSSSEAIFSKHDVPRVLPVPNNPSPLLPTTPSLTGRGETGLSDNTPVKNMHWCSSAANPEHSLLASHLATQL